jgi:hypothetical protein
MSDTNVTLALRLAAAKAAKLASDYEQNRLWPGDLSAGILEIESTLSDARKGDSRG